jgi:glycine C-acetyltransferase/8-amino-7-oxononanoate synthase
MSEAVEASGIAEALAELERLGLSRRLRMVSGPQGPRVLLDGRPVLLLCSNNYLGLADHPRIRAAAAEAAMRWGVGAGASRLVSGTMTIHRRLEEGLAGFAASEACVLFGSGYLANVGLIGALAGHGDTVFSDELNHASIVDGCRLSGAEVIVYRHRDIDHLDWLLRRHDKGAGAKRGGARGGGRASRATEPGDGTLIVTDSVFSMDGDVAPLAEIVELARLHGGRVAVDEAHAIGACGPGGRGVVAQAGLEAEVDVIVGTLGKALGSYGAYVCADRELVRYLINTARPLIFSTAPPPPAVAGALAALELLQERPQRVQKLRSNARVLRRALASEGFPVLDGETHIVALVVGDEHMAMRLCQEAVERGVFAQAIRPPAVPAGTARLRLAAMASHTVAELRTAARVLADAARATGLDPTLFAPALAEEPEWSEGALERSATAGEEIPSPIAAEAAPVPAVFDLERDSAGVRAA